MREYDPDEERLVETVELDDEPDLSAIFEHGWEPRAPSVQALDQVDEIEIPSQPDQQENWRERFVDKGPAAPTPEEDEPERPSFVITEEDEPAGIFNKIKSSVKIALSADESEPAEDAGLDVSEPPSGLIGNLKARMAGESALVAAVAADKKTGFEDLLRPLSGPNLQVLQAQVASEEPIFSQLHRAHRSAEARAHMAFYLGLIPIIAFFAIFGTSYFSETLSSAEIPGWWIDLRDHFSSISLDQWRDFARIGIFALGILLPFLTLFAWVDSIRRILSGVSTRRIPNLIVGLVGFGIAFLVLVYLSKAMIISALVWLVAYGLISAVYSLWNRG